MKMFRVVLVAPDDWDSSWNMCVDMVLDANDKPRAGVPFCGWWGRITSNSVAPFVVQSDGTVVFARDPETREQEWKGHLTFVVIVLINLIWRTFKFS